MSTPQRRHPLPHCLRWLAWRVGLACCIALTASAVWAQGVRIGYVDMQRLLTHAPQILEARSRMQREFDARDAELRVDTARLAELEQRVARTTEEDERASLSRQAEALRRSIERTRQRLREEKTTRVEEETDKAWRENNDAIDEHGREHG